MRERKRRAVARREATARRRARTRDDQRADSRGLSQVSAADKRAAGGKRKTQAVARHPASNTPPRKQPPSPRVKRRRAVVTTVLVGLAVVGFLFAFVYPTSTFLDQRSEMNAAQQRISRIVDETKRLQRENHRLLSDAEVERIAREQYGLVRPGETPYVLVPAEPTTTTTTPTTAPAPTEKQKSKQP